MKNELVKHEQEPIEGEFIAAGESVNTDDVLRQQGRPTQEGLAAMAFRQQQACGAQNLQDAARAQMHGMGQQRGLGELNIGSFGSWPWRN